MRFLIHILFIALLTYVSTVFFPWWTLAIVCFLMCYALSVGAGKGFLTGFSAVFLMWLVVGLFHDVAGDHLLSARIAQLFFLPHWSLLLIIGALPGGIVGGLAGWSGAALRQAVREKKYGQSVKTKSSIQ